MNSKTIILSNHETKGRGILTIFEEDGLLQCRLRLYNTPQLSRFCKLGIYHEKQVTSGNLLEKNGVYTSSMVGNFDINKDFYTAIIDTENENQVIISGGTYAGFFFNDNSVFEENKLLHQVEKENPNTNIYEYTKNETENKCEDDCDKCKTCKYKEFFYSNQPINNANSNPVSLSTNQQNNNISQEIPLEQNSNVENLKTQFQYVFENYEQDEILTSLIPNSKFAKINENSKQYSIGAIYENEQMKYICYATPCNYNSPAPEELGEHYQWLPLDQDDPLSEGYYVVFQDAKDLKIVR
jgi:hypothetical protein